MPAASTRADRAALLAGLLGVLITLLWLGSFNGTTGTSAGDALWVLATSLPLVVLWLGAAVGWGLPLRRWLFPASTHALHLQFGTGIAVLLTLDAALGRAGLLQAGSGTGAWIVTGIGLVLALLGLRRAKRRSLSPPPWFFWAAAPAIGVLLLAATSAPGWLWASEFGGYDALSYHLQLPKEWLAHGAIMPLEHNVYSFLPSYMEAAFYHIMLLRGGSDTAISAVYACQLLHACFAIVTAWLVMQLLPWRLAGAVGAAVLLGTPWMIVAGSLAYNEMAVTLMLATGLLVVLDDLLRPWARGAVLGLVAAAACGAKLTAVGFVAVPLVGILLAINKRNTWLPMLTACCSVGLVVLVPWLVSNAIASGNPVFPFATDFFGTGHWTEAQTNAWQAGHSPASDLATRLVEAWQQFMRYGLGANPYQGEPWFAQWSLLPWLALASAVLWAIYKRRLDAPVNRIALVLLAVFAVQVVFWISFTHIKSRFMLPAAVPLALLVAIGIHLLVQRLTSRGVMSSLLLGIALLVWNGVPIVVFLKQADGKPAARVGMAESLAGRGLDSHAQQQLTSSIPAIYLNTLLADTSRVLLVGEAAPLYIDASISYQTTWDRGPLSQVMRETEDPATQIQLLRERGYTHVLVDGHMLDRWQASGWGDPLLSSQRVLELLRHHTTHLHSFPNGQQLFALRSQRDH